MKNKVDKVNEIKLQNYDAPPPHAMPAPDILTLINWSMLYAWVGVLFHFDVPCLEKISQVGVQLNDGGKDLNFINIHVREDLNMF